MVFWPWIQKSTKQWFSQIFNDPEYSSWETLRIAQGNEKYLFCLINNGFQEFPPGAARSYHGHPGSSQERPRATAGTQEPGASQMNNS